MENLDTSSDILSLASAAGHVMLENGAEISRVEETMDRIASHYGEEKDHFFVLSNGIFAAGKTRSLVEYIPIRAARLDKVDAINQLSRDIVSKDYSMEEAWKHLEIIRKLPPKPLWEQLLGASLGSAAFCALFGGGWADCGASLLAALAVQAFVSFIGGLYFSKMLTNICGGAVGTLLCMLLFSLGLGDHLPNMMIGALIPLIPGVAFTNAMRDLANEDYIAGVTRLLDALMAFLCIAVGVCLSFILHRYISGEMMWLGEVAVSGGTASIPVQVLAAFIGTSGFSIVYGVPRKNYLACGVVGMMGWLTYLLIVRFSPMGPVAGTFFAALLVAVLSRWSAVRYKSPGILFMIPGIFPLIPGVGVFWSSYYVVSEQLGQSLHAGFLAVKVTMAIVVAIVIVTNIFHSPARKKGQKKRFV